MSASRKNTSNSGSNDGATIVSGGYLSGDYHSTSISSSASPTSSPASLAGLSRARAAGLAGGFALTSKSTASRHEGKIFGIGLPKTGTSSLDRALGILGYRSGHFPSDPDTVAELKAGRYDLSILNSYDALSDVPIPAIFAQLDAAWPGSKFVLTVRDPDSWLESCRNAPFNRADQVPEAGSTREFYRILLYGTVRFQADRFAWVYETHVRNVIEHFAGEKSDQLLVLDVVGGEGWEKLCPFLGVPQPNVPFPHDNSRLRPTDSGGTERKPEGRSKLRGISSILRRRR